MVAHRAGLILGAAAMLLVCAAGAAAQVQGGEVRVEVRTQSDDPQPHVRVWVNGREVDPGEVVGMGAPAVPGGPRLGGTWFRWFGREEAYLGVEVSAKSEKAAEEPGVTVVRVVPDSPAQDAGLAAGDVITSVAGRKVKDPEQFVDLVRSRKPGERVDIAWTRDGKSMEKRITLGVRPAGAWPSPERPEDKGRPQAEKQPEKATGEGYLGVMAAPLTDDVRQLAGTDRGVLINSLQDGSPAAEAGLMPGDVITAIDGKAVDGPQELTERIRSHKPGDKVEVEYYRSGKKRSAEVKLSERPGVPEARERFRFFRWPERWPDEFSELREYLRDLGRWLQEGRWPREGAPPEPPRRWMPMPPVPPRTEPSAPGKDIGRLEERLQRLEKRLEELERRLDQAARKA